MYAYKFLYVNVEYNNQEPIRTDIRQHLEKYGYLYKGPNAWDDDYIHESVIIGSYTYNDNDTKIITIKKKFLNYFVVESPYWPSAEGKYVNGCLTWNSQDLSRLGVVYYDRIDYGRGNVWNKINT